MAPAAWILGRRAKIVGVGLLGAVAVSTPAYAEPAGQSGASYPPCTKTTVSANESDLAHQKYIAGKQDYDEGNYDSAIKRFRDAYTLDCTKHELLVIISAAYERKGDRKEAVSALETYVNRAPNAPDVGTYQSKIENLKKQIASAPSPTAPAPATSTPANGTASTDGGGTGGGHTAYPWILVGVGGAAVVAGVIILATTPPLPTGCDATLKKCDRLAGESDSSFSDRQSQAGRHLDQPGVGLIVMGAGAAVALGGVVWHFLEPTGPKEGQSRLTPSVSPGYAGLSFDTRF